MNHDEAHDIREQLTYMVEVLHRLVSMTADTLTALQLLIEVLGVGEPGTEEAHDGE
jgi:hypothetical protein